MRADLPSVPPMNETTKPTSEMRRPHAVRTARMALVTVARASAHFGLSSKSALRATAKQIGSVQTAQGLKQRTSQVDEHG